VGKPATKKDSTMPNPRNNMKQSGDLHPPELGEDDAREVEPMQSVGTEFGASDASAASVLAARPATAASTATDTSLRDTNGPMSFNFGESTEGYLNSARDQVRRKPVAYAAGALLIGFVLGVITRG
jgi:hypothetical protein